MTDTRERSGAAPSAPRPGPRRALAALVALVALLGACGGGDEAGSAPPDATATTAVSSASPTTAEVPTTTAAPPTTSAPTAGPAPVTVAVVGDSVGYTIAEGAPGEIPGVTDVEDAALPGCGLLRDGPRPPESIAAGAPPDYTGCAQPVADADARALAAQPDVVLLVLGAWERSDHQRDGRTVGPGDDLWVEYLQGLLGERLDTLSSGGARVALWVDPCGPDADTVARQGWFRDEVLAPVAADHPAATLVDPTPVMCTPDGAPRTDVEGVGSPRADDGQHLTEPGAAWLWTSWLGPTLATVGAA